MACWTTELSTQVTKVKMAMNDAEFYAPRNRKIYAFMTTFVVLVSYGLYRWLR